MKQDNNELTKLLSLDHLYSLYSRIGDSINNDIDLYGGGYDPDSRDNSITLLKKCGLVAEEDEAFFKTKSISDIDRFAAELLKNIRVVYPKTISDIFALEKKYDENRGLFYIPQNKIDLQVSGLLMLLHDLNFVQVLSGKVYIFDEAEIKKFLPESYSASSKRMISLIELEHELAIKKAVGELGEKKALEYEKRLLTTLGIDGVPKIISSIDVGAGYDMVSFLGPESTSYDKYIEVKSCQDMKQAFYISNNELKVAKEKGGSYYLYIYVREEDKIVVINNPYEKVFLSSEWAKESQIYRIHKIIGGDLV